MRMSKVMLSIDDRYFQVLKVEAKDRGISLQELMRAVVIPEWAKSEKRKRL